MMAAQDMIAAALLGLGVFASFFNWVYLLLPLRTGRLISAVPLVKGLCLASGALLLPPLRPYAWLAVFLDYGTLVALLGVPAFARELWETSRSNLLEEYAGQ